MESHRPMLALLGTPKHLGEDPGLAQMMYQAQLTVFLTTLSALMHATAMLGTAGMKAKETLPDGRPIPPPRADERAMLEAWLDFHRTTLALKCSGLKDDQLRIAAASPSSMTLLGLVQHMAEVERNWFQRVFAGQDLVPVFGEGNLDGFRLQPERGLDEAMNAWQSEITRGRELIADASLDDDGRLPEQEAGHVGDQGVSLRWIMVHMIEEYARHNGHADLIREQIDGATGA
ncbi:MULTISPECIES: DinB family protein [unclassified Streptomyces]|uniref:DinB family protein n=2 Tax=unclassified Streptomyces TaxID=2593676 RepID=UPI002B1DB6D9|nr:MULTISPECIES: DinB family protein [unclassified Streptomyces]